jgi:DNA-binding NtrC family response regulator
VTGTFDDSSSVHGDGERMYGPALVVLLECDRPLAGGARYSLEGIDRVFIGRGEKREVSRSSDNGVKTLDVRLPGRSLSTAHARLVRVGTSWSIEDLKSKNGAFVGGKRVERAILGAGEVFELGHVFLRINQEVPAVPGEPLDSESEKAPQATLDPVLAGQFEALSRIATSDVPLLILGDSGTGKELLAHTFHSLTARRGEFVAVNCGAIPSNLVESSFFGHMKGAFSGAVRDEQGFVRAAHGGTLFLDEIADLPTAPQAALLRVLQERAVVPVGATRALPVDVRLMAATNRCLEDMVAQGDFRRDLFARISGFVFRLPALRERRDDFGLLVAALLRKVAGARTPAVTLAPDAGRALLAYEWPLNIRELEQCLTACVALAASARVERSHLPAHIARAGEPATTASAPAPAGTRSARDDRLRLVLLAQLAQHEGNLADVARAMGKARMQIHRWCKRFGVDPNVYRR